MKRQANNKRNTVYLTYKDKTLSLSEWSDITKKLNIVHYGEDINKVKHLNKY